MVETLGIEANIEGSNGAMVFGDWIQVMEAMETVKNAL